MRPFTARLGVLFISAFLAACSGNQGAVPSTANAPASGAPTARAASLQHGGELRVTAADKAAAYRTSNFSYHLFPTVGRRTTFGAGAGATKVFHPADLTYFHGPLMKTAVEHDIYVNCKTHDQKCWGDPEGFFGNLTGSTFVKLLTQYTKAGAGAYTFGEGTPVSYTNFSKYYYDNDLFSILHAAASAIGKNGYGDEYHIFLPRGADTCFDGTNVCYSPDVRSTFYFCAYHGSVTFSDLGVITYSVEPYQNVQGCTYSSLPKGFNKLNNATDTTLAHETFESITDPNPNSFSTLGWYNLAYNSEIGDLCDAYPTTITLGKVKYYLQTMYSNKYHGCADGP